MNNLFQAVKESHFIVVSNNKFAYFDKQKFVEIKGSKILSYDDVVKLLNIRADKSKPIVIPAQCLTANTLSKLKNNRYDINVDTIGYCLFLKISAKKSARIKVTGKKASAIKQALNLWDEQKSRTKFVNAMIENGWHSHNGGSYKKVFEKDGIIVKFDRGTDRPEVGLEYLQYLRASKEFKKHLARIYCLHNGLLVQDAVIKKPTYGRKIVDNASRLASQYNLSDWGHNYGIDKNKNVVFHDIVDNKVFFGMTENSGENLLYSNFTHMNTSDDDRDSDASLDWWEHSSSDSYSSYPESHEE